MAMHPQEISSMTVCELQQLTFPQLSLDEKVTVKKRGRPTPDIQVSQPGISNNRKYIRSFNSEWYQRKSWLCGCEVKNSVFCFPCLLFGGDATWTKYGFKNLNKMKGKTEKHEKSKEHIDNAVSLSLLGTDTTEIDLVKLKLENPTIDFVDMEFPSPLRMPVEPDSESTIALDSEYQLIVPKESRKPKRRISEISDMDKSLNKPITSNTSVENEYEAVGVNVVCKLRRMEEEQRNLAEFLINKVILKGLRRKLTDESDII